MINKPFFAAIEGSNFSDIEYILKNWSNPKPKAKIMAETSAPDDLSHKFEKV